MGTVITEVVKRTGAIVPFNPERITNAIYRAAVAVGGRDRSIAENLAGQVVTILEENTPPGHIPHVEEIQDIVEKVLIENGHARTAKAYILYRAERARRRGEKSERSRWGDGHIPYRKIYEVLNWSVDHHVQTVSQLNERIAGAEFPAIVQESEDVYERDVDTAAEIIRARQDQVRMVIVAGPSSSGKTTTTTKLSERLSAMGLNLVALNVDNYFFDLELHPKDEFGDYDFETPQALDLDLINEHLVKLLAGEEVRIPFYDFHLSKRTLDVTPLRIGPGDIILIDSLHGLYSDMTRDLADDLKFRLYVETLLQMKDNNGRFIRWTDLRLMRRMVRDAQFRAYNPEETLLHWHYVRSSELRNIIPHVHTADYIINSGLPYELPIMKVRLMDHFETWADKYADDPQRVDAAIRSKRVRDLLRTVTAVEDDSPIPAHSLLREFIGGSCYKY
jgi:uridine kinase